MTSPHPRGGKGEDMDKKTQHVEAALIATAAIVFVIFTVALCFGIALKKGKQGNFKVDTRATDEEMKTEEDLSQRSIFFAGIEDTTVTKGQKIALENLEGNRDFLMRYIVKDADTDKTIFETDLIPSGERVYFDPSSVLSPGEYDIAFIEQPYMPQGEDYIPLTVGRNVVKITVKGE